MDISLKVVEELKALNIVSSCPRKWALLACDILLKDKAQDITIYIKTLELLLSLLEPKDLNENEWKFAIDCTRRGIKRVGKCDVVCVLLELIACSMQSIICTDHLLKLVITCKEQDLEISNNFHPFLRSQYQEFSRPLPIFYDEFNFIDCELQRRSLKQRCHRLLILFDPLKGIQSCPEATDENWFNLLSLNDSELITFMAKLIHQDRHRFFQFYSKIVCKNLLQVDFFVDQLLTDSVRLLEVLLAIFSEPMVLIDPKQRKHFKNFHMLLLLKLETSSASFPFNCAVLIYKLSDFNNKISIHL